MSTTLQDIQSAYKNAKAQGFEKEAQQLSAMYQKAYKDIQRQKYPDLKESRADETGVLGNFFKGIPAGAVGLYSSAALGAIAPLEEEAELAARKKILETQEALSFENVDEDSIAYNLGQGVGSILGLVPAAFAGPAALPVAAVISGAAGAGESSERARAAGATEEERNIAAMKGVGVGLTEMIPLGRFADKLKIPGLSDVMDKMVGRIDSKTINGIITRLRRMAGTAVIEGGQEASAAILQNLVQAGYDPEQELINMGVLEEGAYGGGSGAIVQGLRDVLVRKGRRTKVTDDSPTTPEDRAEQRKFDERQEKAREERDDIQGDMFADELSAAEQEQRERQGPPKPETADKPETETARDTRTRDMVDELETAELEAMVESDKIEATRKLDAARAKKQADTTRINRRKILEKVFDSSKSTNMVDIAKEFETALKEDGYRNFIPTKSEIKSIQTYTNMEQRKARNERVQTDTQRQNIFDARQESARRERDPDQKDMFPDELRTELDKLNILPSSSDVSTLEARIKERVNVGEQATRTSDTGTARDGVPSSTEVVGQQRATSAPVTGRSQQGRLDGGKRDARRPTRRKRRSTTALEQQELPLGSPQPRTAAQLLGTEKPKPAALIDTPTTKKRVLDSGREIEVINYSASSTLVPEHKKLGQDRKKLKAVYDLPTTKRIKAGSLDRAIPADTKEVAMYMQKFGSPMSAILNAVYQVSGSKNNPLKDAGINTRGLNPKRAEKVLDWAKNNLSQETNAAIRAKIKEIRQADAKEAEANKQAEAKKESAKKAKTVKSRKAKKAGVKVTRKTVKKDDAPKAKAEPKAQPKPKAEAQPKAKAQSKAKAQPKAEPAKKEVEIDQEAVDKRKVEETKREIKVEVMQQIAKKWKGTGVSYGALRRMLDDYGSKYMLNEATKEDIIDVGTRYESEVVREFKISKEDGKVLLRMVSDKVDKLLRANKLKEALLELAKTAESSELRANARNFANKIANTKVEFATGEETVKRYPQAYKNADEVPFAYYDYRTDTITLKEGFNTTTHFVLHETSHALSEVAIEKNPNSPAVKALYKLFKDVKGKLGTAYGTTDIHEFLAEGLNNRVFRKELGKIKVDGKEYTALDKFINIIKNILRMLRGDPPRQLGSALQEIDRLAEAILEPNLDPNFRYVRSDRGSIREMAKSTTDRLEEARLEVKEHEPGLIDFWKNMKAKGAGLRGLAKVIHLSTLADIATVTGFEDLGHRLHREINKQRGGSDSAIEANDKFVKEQREFFESVGSKVFNAFNRIVFSPDYGATIYDVDPFGKRSDYEGKTYETVDLAEVFDELQRELKAFPPAMREKMKQQFYKERAYNNSSFTEIEKAMDVETDRIIGESGNEAGRKLLRDINRRLLSKAKIKNYWSLVRDDGEFRIWFSYTKRDPKTGEALGVENSLLTFEHVAQRDAMVEKLEADPDVDNSTITQFNGELTRDIFEKAPSGSFVSDILDLLNKEGVKPDIQDQIIRMYAASTPENSFVRSLIARKGDFGYEQNVMTAAQTRGRSLALQAAKIRSAAEIRMVKKLIIDKAAELNRASKIPNPKINAVRDSLIEDHANFALMGAKDKGKEYFIKHANQLAFLYTLGFNLSSAIVNMTQVPLFVMPYLAPRFGVTKTIDEFMRAARMVGGARMSIKEFYDIKGTGEAATYTLKESHKKKIREHAIDEKTAEAEIEQLESLIPVIKEANLQGKLFGTNINRELGVDEKASRYDKLMRASAYFFVQGERFNTQTVIIGSYNLIREQMANQRKAGKKYYSPRLAKEIDVPENVNEMRKIAALDAIYLTQETNGGSTLETTMPLAKQDVGRVALMYKGYGVLMNSAMVKAGIKGILRIFSTPQERKIGLQQLAGIHLSAAIFAGVGGTPLWGIVSTLWDMYLDDDEDDADTRLRKFIKEDFYKGPVSTITGMAISERVKLNDLIFQSRRYMRDPSVEANFGHYLGGPFVSTLGRFQRGMKDWSDGNFLRGTEAFAPAGVSNVLTSFRYYDEGITTRAGEPMLDDVKSGEIFSKFLGFMPTDLAFNSDKSSRDQKVTRAIGDKRKKLTGRYYKALRDKDYQELADVWEDIKEFNRKYKGEKFVITRESIRDSVKAQHRSAATKHNGVVVSPLYREALRRSWEEYSQ